MSSVHNQDKDKIELRTLKWVQNVVIGLNLCPFANRVVKTGNLVLHTEFATDTESVLTTLANLCDNACESEAEHTALLILPNGFVGFDDFLDLVDISEALLVDLQLENDLQIATFHPKYQFSESEYNDLANFTNRSPYPMLHLLKVDAVSDAIDQHPNTDSIPDRNIKLLRSMDSNAIQQLVSDEDAL